MAKFIHINSVMRVNLANLNSSEGGGNQITLKKVTAFNGEEFVYVSGQAYRRYLRETIYWLTDKKFVICGIDSGGSPIIKQEEESLIENKKVKDPTLKAQGYKGILEYIIQNVPELDLFGFLLPLQEKEVGALRKASPFQTTAFISSFPYRYNTDMLTRSKAEEMGGDIVKIEIDTFNYLQGAQIINTEMVGSYWDEHIEKAVGVVEDNERNKRINWLLSALQNTMGGSKKARLLTDFSPVLVVAAIQKTGVPYFSHKFEISPHKDIKAQSLADVKGNLDLKAFLKTYDSAKFYLEKIYWGIDPNAFLNGNEIKEAIENTNKNNSNPEPDNKDKEVLQIEICGSPREVYDKLKNEFPENQNKSKE